MHHFMGLPTVARATSWRRGVDNSSGNGRRLKTAGVLRTLVSASLVACSGELAGPLAPTTGGEASRTASAIPPETMTRRWTRSAS